MHITFSRELRSRVMGMFIAAVIASTAISIGAGYGGGGGGGGGGGHTEPVGNNLSFPVIWGDGSMALQGMQFEATLTDPWPVLVTVDGYTHCAFAQKTEGNTWQAENEMAGVNVDVDAIDWGDSLEAVDMKVGRPVRIELSLYKVLEEPMVGYRMVMLANPSSPDEVQGVLSDAIIDELGNITYDSSAAETYASYEATVYSQFGRLVLQKLIPDRETVEANPAAVDWNGSRWIDVLPDDGIGVEAPQALTFTGELNVGGKVIYGLSQGGWRPNESGDYRATFFFNNPEGKVHFDDETIIKVSADTETASSVTVAAEEGEPTAGGVAYVEPDHNITYIDIRVVGGGGGGGKKPLIIVSR